MGLHARVDGHHVMWLAPRLEEPLCCRCEGAKGDWDADIVHMSLLSTQAFFASPTIVNSQSAVHVG